MTCQYVRTNISNRQDTNIKNPANYSSNEKRKG